MKNIKRFLLISLLIIAFSGKLTACVGHPATYNYFLMSLAPVNCDCRNIDERINKFWSEYTGGKFNEYHGNSTEIFNFAKKKKDTEMIEYLNYLNAYLYYGNAFVESWDYPTKEDLSEAERTVKKIIKASREYKGERFKSQYALLYMRANMLDENYADMVSYWKNKAQYLPESVYKEMIENYYAGALFHLGDKEKALNIFSRQGDFKSIKWCVKEQRNLSGIKKIYRENPNSEALYYLVQDFVNRSQDAFDEEPENEIDEMVDKSEMLEFISFANEVIKENKTDDPCLWNAACALLYDILKDKNNAKKYINIALNSKGRALTKDNARCINLWIASNERNLDLDFITKELKWIDSKIASAKANDYYFINVKEKVLMLSLLPKFWKKQNTNLICAIEAENDRLRFERYKIYDTTNEYYIYRSNDYSYHLMNLSAQEIESFVYFVKEKHKEGFEKYICSTIKIEDNFFNDLIGTTYIAQGEFAKAIGYLEKVPLSFINELSVAYYMQRRDYRKESWFERQPLSDDGEEMYKLQTMKTNCKVDFCKEMLNLENQFSKASDNKEKQELAYKLAVRYYQASSAGDCWFLSRYYKPSYYDGKDRIDETLLQKCTSMLNISKQGNKELKTKSLYALAFIPRDNWAEYDYNWNDGTFTITKVYKNSLKYKRLNDLYTFIQQNPDCKTEYIRKCDVFYQFAKRK